MRTSEFLNEPEQLPVLLHGGLEPVTLDRQRAALLIVDMQEHIARPYRGPKALAARELGIEGALDYYWHRVQTVVCNFQRLRQAFRDARMEVIYLTAGTLSPSGRERSLSQRCSHAGMYYRTANGEIRPNPEPSPIIPELAPGPDEIVIGKYGASPFGNTNIDFVLHNLGITTLVVGGLITNQCVEATIRGAFDYGFLPILAEDASGTYTDELQRGTIRSIGDWFCSVRTTDEILAEVEAFRVGSIPSA